MVKYIHKYTKEPVAPVVKKEEPYKRYCDDCDHMRTNFGDDYEIDGYSCTAARYEFCKRDAPSCPSFDDKYRKMRCDYCTSYGLLHHGYGACLNMLVPDIKLVTNENWDRAKTCEHFDYEARKTMMVRKEPWKHDR